MIPNKFESILHIGFFVRESTNFRLRTDLNDPDIEILTIQICKQNVKLFLITRGIAHQMIQLRHYIDLRTVYNLLIVIIKKVLF